MKSLRIDNLHIAVANKEIVKGLSLEIKPGEIHALMGPNGSGKSTLAAALMGSPNYKITSGRIYLGEQDITNSSATERARAGLFLAFQNPVAVPGLPVINFLYTVLAGRAAQPLNLAEFREALVAQARLLAIDEKLLERCLNDGWSGGEKKKTEILQMAVLQPSMAILDETDSGLDIDALETVARGMRRLMESAGNKMGLLIITHYQALWHHIQPDFIHVMVAGKIMKSGGQELAGELERTGYESLFSSG